MVRSSKHRFLVPVLGLLIVGIIFSGVVMGVNFAQAESERSSVPSVTVYPAVAELHAKTALVLLGSGFEPGEELTLLMGDTLGVLMDLGASAGFLDPPAVADESGNFVSKFQVGRIERISAEQAWGIIVMDGAASEVLATAPMAFCDPQGRARRAPYPRGAPDYEKNPDDPRPAPYCKGRSEFEYPEKPE